MIVFLSGAGMKTTGEKANAHGITDLVATVKDYVYVFEFKFLKDKDQKPPISADKLLEMAVNQIIEKKYGVEFASKKLIRLAMVFSQDKKEFIKWESVPLEASL